MQSCTKCGLILPGHLMTKAVRMAVRKNDRGEVVEQRRESVTVCSTCKQQIESGKN